MRTLTSRIRCVVVATTAAGSDATIAGDGLLVALANGAGATGELGATGKGIPVDEDVGVGSATGGGLGVDGGSGGGGVGGVGGTGGAGG